MTTNLVHGIEYEIIDRIHDLRLCRHITDRLFVLDASDEEKDLDASADGIPLIGFDPPTYREMFIEKATRIIRDCQGKKMKRVAP